MERNLHFPLVLKKLAMKFIEPQPPSCEGERDKVRRSANSIATLILQATSHRRTDLLSLGAKREDQIVILHILFTADFIT